MTPDLSCLNDGEDTEGSNHHPECGLRPFVIGFFSAFEDVCAYTSKRKSGY